MKKKEFKAAVAAKLVETNSTEGKEFKVDENILESSTCKLGRQIRVADGVLNDWPEKQIGDVVVFYNDYGKKPETSETAKEKPAAKKKATGTTANKKKAATTKKATAKPMRNKNGKFAKKAATKKKATKKK